MKNGLQLVSNFSYARASLSLIPDVIVTFQDLKLIKILIIDQYFKNVPTLMRIQRITKKNRLKDHFH